MSAALRLNGSLSADYSEGDDLSAGRTAQFLSASYSPPARPLGGFTYSWSGNGDVGNSYGDIEGSRLSKLRDFIRKRSQVGQTPDHAGLIGSGGAAGGGGLT